MSLPWVNVALAGLVELSLFALNDKTILIGEHYAYDRVL